MEPVILDAAGDGEVPAFRWRFMHACEDTPCRAWAIGLYHDGPGEWFFGVNVGRWVVGIERTREED